MVSAAIINAALGGGAAGLSKGLYLDGTNVLTQQGGVAGSAFGSPIGSIVHTEVGPPGISALTWSLDDPAKVISPQRGMRVQLYDHVNDRPLFYGWLQRWKATPWGLGRQWAMTAQGAEVLLDWAIVPSVSWAAGEAIADVIARAAAVAHWPPTVSVRWASGFLTGSSQSLPVSSFAYAFGSQTVTMAVAGSLTAQTLRATITGLFAASHVSGFDEWAGVAVNGPFVGVATIDPYLGLRCYGKTEVPTDYADLTVTDTSAGTLVAMGLEHEAEASGIPSGVFVNGGAAAGTGPVMAGDGIPGPMRVISDSSILTDTARKAAANAMLTDQGNLPERGSLTISDHQLTDNVHPGSHLVLTDAETGATGTYVISQLVRTFTATRQTWQVSYGSLPPSLPRVIRYLTRGVLS